MTDQAIREGINNNRHGQLTRLFQREPTQGRCTEAKRIIRDLLKGTGPDAEEAAEKRYTEMYQAWAGKS